MLWLVSLLTFRACSVGRCSPFCCSLLVLVPSAMTVRPSPRPGRKDRSEPAPPGYYASWYASAFRQSSAQGSYHTASGSAAATTLSAVELRSRLDKKINALLQRYSPLERSKGGTGGPPSAQLAEIEEVSKPTESEVLTRCMLPLLQLTLENASMDQGVLDLALEELGHVLDGRAPELRPLVHAIRVSVDAALRRRTAAAPPEGTNHDPGGSVGSDAGEASSAAATNPAAHEHANANSTPALPPQPKPPPQGLTARPSPRQPQRRSSESQQRHSRESRYSSESVRSTRSHASDGDDDPDGGEASSSSRSAARNPEAGRAYQKRMDEAEDLFIAMQVEEQAAAVTLQRHRRGIQDRRAVPGIRAQVEQARREKAAVVKLQSVTRGWLQRTYAIREFRRMRAARCLQRGARAMLRRATRMRMLHKVATLTEAQIDKALAARDAFLLLEKPSRTALLPTLLAMFTSSVEALTQAGDVWAGMVPSARANAVVAYVRECEPMERQQVLRLLLQAIEPAELMRLLHWVTSHSKPYWGLQQTELLQSLLRGLQQAGADPASVRAAKLAEDKLVNGLVDTLPAETVAKSLQRLALYSHLPPIRSQLPKEKQKPYERIQQARNLPPRSYRAVLQGPIAGGLFGPAPVNDKAFLPKQETQAPPGRQRAPELSPRVPRDPRELERAMQQRREAEGGTPAPRESVHYPPPPRGLLSAAAEHAGRGPAGGTAGPRATPNGGVTNVPSWLQPA